MRSVYPTNAERTNEWLANSQSMPGAAVPADPHFTKKHWSVDLTRPVPLALWVLVPLRVPRILMAKREGSSLPRNSQPNIPPDPGSGPHRFAKLSVSQSSTAVEVGYWLMTSWFRSYLCWWTARTNGIRSLWASSISEDQLTRRMMELLAAAVTPQTEKALLSL